MEQNITCPNCLNTITIKTIGKIKNTHIIFEPFNYNEKEGKYYAPRGRFNVKINELEERKHFLLNNWADKIKIFDQRGKLIEEVWK